MEGAYKIVRINNFKNIIVSPYSKNGRVIDDNGFWEFNPTY